ncbi:MAG: aminotransferase class IV [Nocardioidaceae bacterium]|nr:aminotransferase class IV [Nocardioidaceae bacterium]MCL2612204.1 aminotransferase class IV [Nocardioidaceae bacterium]
MQALFETVRVVGGQPFALDLHLARLERSAAATGLATLDVADVRRRLIDVLARDPLPLGRVRVTAAGGDLAITPAPTPPPAESIAVVTAPWRLNEHGPLVGHKTTAYADNVVALRHAVARGAGECVLANAAGNVCEGTGANVFYVVDGELRTPTLASGCLPGVTRHLVLDWYGAREVDEPLEVCASAEEVFLTSSIRTVQPVHRWDDRDLPVPGPVTRRVLETWRTREHEMIRG